MKLRPIIFALFTLIAVVGLSLWSAALWGGKPEKIELPELTIVSTEITPAGIAHQYNLPIKPVAKALGVDPAAADTTTLAELGIAAAEAEARIHKSLVQYYEEQSKDWRKIAAKFILWFVLMPIPFVLLLRKKVTPRRRKLLVGLGVLIFGVALGSDPSPMGTVKDAVFLLTAHKTVFMPRMIALTAFLATVVVANKFICSWGCQFGLLQEFLFRLNRQKFDRRGIMRQYKVPFVVSNSIRVIVFAAMIAIGLLWALDIVGLVDPFKIFAPAAMTVAGIVFIALVLALSLFVYRPWCHFACPFGLVSWLFEKLSIFRIKVDYNKCDACGLCERACPSNVMSAILRSDKRTIPDCFSCASCIDSCPQDAIDFTSSRAVQGTFEDSLKVRELKKSRTDPPAGSR